MNFDVECNLSAVQRTVQSLERDGVPGHSIQLSRNFAATPEDLWDAITNAERIPRWFLPIIGNFKVGGHYQLEGNAGGKILKCKRQSHIALTWEFGGDVSWVDVNLSVGPDGSTCLTLTHTSIHSKHWKMYGAGATGVGWELGLLGLIFHLQEPNNPRPDELEFITSEDGKAFISGSSERWGDASVAAGADPVAVNAAVKNTTAFYTGEPV